jgi:hypothetical protein
MRCPGWMINDRMSLITSTLAPLFDLGPLTAMPSSAANVGGERRGLRRTSPINVRTRCPSCVVRFGLMVFSPKAGTRQGSHEKQAVVPRGGGHAAQPSGHPARGVDGGCARACLAARRASVTGRGVRGGRAARCHLKSDAVHARCRVGRPAAAQRRPLHSAGAGSPRRGDLTWDDVRCVLPGMERRRRPDHGPGQPAPGALRGKPLRLRPLRGDAGTVEHPSEG